MIENYKVVGITPAGRRNNLEVLEPYMIANQGVIDSWMIWINTPHQEDINHIQSIKARYSDFVELVYSETPLQAGSRPQSPFFKTAIDPKTVYVKFDDDICWIAPDAVETLVKFRLHNRTPFFVMANTVMNGYCAYLHQKYGAQEFKINEQYERIPPEFANKVWSNPRYAEYVHRTFIQDLFNQDLEKYKFESWELSHYQRVAINCITWLGSDFAEFNGIINHIDEELWMCCIKAKELQRPNAICGNSMVAHHAFYKHRKPHCAGKEIDSRILKAYKKIAQGYDSKIVMATLNSKIMI